jgi:glycosyltransferase involved in cell wall biosynthesis
MASIVIPAHNEAASIERCLRSLILGAATGELEIVVVANGCSDETAHVARGFGDQVRVIEVTLPSKANALNLGDREVSSFPRLYVDADVVMSCESVRAICTVLNEGRVLAAAPAVDTVFPPQTSWWVRGYYDFWMALPYVREGMMAAGAYAVSEAGRRRFGDFPDVISDDGFVRLQFEPAERVEVPAARSLVTAPGSLSDLVRIKTRSRVGAMQLKANYPELFARETRTKRYGVAMIEMLLRPRLYLCALPYLWVGLVSLVRARRQRQRLQHYRWERDESSRERYRSA